MKIIVCIKQVPALSDVLMDSEKGVLIRTGENKMNPYDGAALETALCLKERYGGSVTALTMGPKASEQVLRTALAMGADQGCLMTDKAFAGADVLVTAATLSAGMEFLGGADVIFCGQQTTDGDTAQVPFSLAEQLGIPVLGWIRKICNYNIENACLDVEQELTGVTYRMQGTLPLVLAVNPTIAQARIPGLKARLKASKHPIKVIALSDLTSYEADCFGLTASPTRVVKLFSEERERKSPIINTSSEEQAEILFREWKKVKEKQL